MTGVVADLDIEGKRGVDRGPDQVVRGDRDVGLVAERVPVVAVRGAVVGVVEVVPPVPADVGPFVSILIAQCRFVVDGILLFRLVR